MSNDSLKSLVREFVADSKFQAIAQVESDRKRNLTDVLDQLRGVCGITVVTVLEPPKPLSANKEITKVKIKFLQTHPSLALHIKKMKISARKLEGIYSFQVYRVKPAEERTSKKD